MNNGQMAKYYVEDNHEAIIDKEIFEAVKTEMARRAEKAKRLRKPKVSEFSGLITCGRCGARFRMKANAIGMKYAKAWWACSTYIHRGKRECAAKRIPEDILEEKCAQALGLTEYNPTVFTAKVAAITIPADGVLVFTFKDGTTRTRSRDFMSWFTPRLRPVWWKWRSFRTMRKRPYWRTPGGRSGRRQQSPGVSRSM